MARILILTNNDIGLYKFRKELIEELLKDNEVLTSLPDGEFVSQLVDLGCEFIDTQISRRGTNPITDFKLMLEYKKIIKHVKPDVVLTYTIKPNVYGGMMCRLMKVPYLANITGLGTAVENGGVLQSVTIFLYKVALKKASCIFFQNKGNADFINSKGIVRGKQRLIPGSGVNLNHYQVLDYPSDEIINFLFISRVMKQKGIDQYLDAAEYIKGKYPKTEFHVLGFCEHAYEAKLNEMNARGVIQYHGMQSDVRKFHEISHCTIHPTYYPEGMSNVLLESAACGRPIITTNRIGCKEIVDNGINGYVIDQQNSQDLIDKIEKFLDLDNETKKQMGLAGRNKVEREFDRQIVIDAYKEEIMNVIHDEKTFNE
ncbi:MAG: glycosyltransferase family 4 protein [Bacillota bacterium]